MKLICSEHWIKDTVSYLGRLITDDYIRQTGDRIGKDLILLGIYHGASVFMADLCRNINLPEMLITYCTVSSYSGTKRRTSGTGLLVYPASEELLRDRHVILVEDIIDSGNTLEYVVKDILDKKVRSLRIATMLRKDKPENWKVLSSYPHYIGYTLPRDTGFVIGYGMDIDGKYRGLPYIAEAIGKDI